MPSDSRNLTMAKAMRLIYFAVWCRFSLRGAFCHANVRTYNELFMDLPGHSFDSHSSLLTMKSAHFVAGMGWLQFLMEIICNFNSGYFDCRSSFKQLLIHIAVQWVEHNWQQNVFFSDNKYVSEVHSSIVLMRYEWVLL